MFTEAVYRKPTIIMLMLMVIQQLGGINAIIMYLTSIFIAAGTDLDEGLQGSVLSDMYKMRQQLLERVQLTQKLEIHHWKFDCLISWAKTCFISVTKEAKTKSTKSFTRVAFYGHSIFLDINFRTHLVADFAS